MGTAGLALTVARRKLPVDEAIEEGEVMRARPRLRERPRGHP